LVEIVEISKYELIPIIHYSYEGDFDLANLYHLKKYTIEEAALRTIELINEHEKQVEFKFLKVICNSTLIGYFITSGDFLYSFCVRMEFRTKEVLTEWWKAILDYVGNNIKIGIMSNNTRAIKYFEKRGMSITWQNPEMNEPNEILFTF